ncbi:DUF6262 family protein [Lentzea sp. E54]|uniref:DUF6262 family protein n=1 Tax=Lentzea xerophila TaxID=3435883 RepID=UPI003DA4382F
MPDQQGRDRRVARLRESAETRSADAVARTHRAITVLANREAPVTFASVAAEAQVSQSFLYKHGELTERIKKVGRPRSGSRARNGAEAASAASLRVQLAVATEKLEKANQTIAEQTTTIEALRGEVSDLRARLRRHAK